ncbi:MAG: hypothetical protein WBN04_06255 [Paracoccaceae bacterium]
MTPVGVSFAALSGADFPHVRPVPAVAVGDPVHVGQVLFTDRAHPAIAWVAPLAGVVESVDLGPRRYLSALVIRAQDGLPDPVSDIPDASSNDTLRAVLQSRGMWPAFLSRPFGRIPLPDENPAAIFVTATETEPWAPDPQVVLQERLAEFFRGVEALGLLTEGLVHLCLPKASDLTAPNDARIRTSRFAGSHPAGLAGTHLRRLHPVGAGAPVWSIGYQDVIAIGHLLDTGRFLAERVISIAGPRAARRRLVRTVIGASIHDLTTEELLPVRSQARAKVISGSILSGRESAWLGYRHRQVSLLDRAPQHSSRSRQLWPFVVPGPSALIPTAKLDAALPFALPVVPLMRALAVGDAEAAVRLGCLNLVEEDVALLSSLCSSGADYGHLLRVVLDELAEAA